MSSNDLQADRAAMQLARRALEYDSSARLGWILRNESDRRVVERTIQLILAFHPDGNELGIQLATSKPEPAAPVRVPDFIDRFQVLGLLGAGAFSYVYRARDESTGREVALKVLHAADVSPQMARRFDREIAVLSALDHDSIASLIDAGSSTSDLGVVRWIALELVDGESFQEAIKELDPRAITRLVARVAHAVHHAHAQGVIHRDLKPSNVLIDGRGQPKVVDFGIASLKKSDGQQRLTATDQVLGTIGYMSPEQVAGNASNAASDQFSLGVMLFEALTGGLPHSEGQDGIQGLFSIASWDGRIDPRERAKLEGPLAAVLDRSLDPDPALRYPSAQAFADDLERWVEGKAVLTQSPGHWRRTRRFVERNRGPVVAGAAIVLLLGAALGVTLAALGNARYQSARASSLGDQTLLPLLLKRAGELWPQSPEMVPEFDRWIAAAEGVIGRSDEALASIQGESLRATFGQELSALVEVSQAVCERRELAATLGERTVAAHQDDWASVSERVRLDARFDGWSLPPQLGLIPLGPDPSSGLEEFAVSDWGSIPTRDSGSGELLLEDDFTPVLVLIPGGQVEFGCPTLPLEERVAGDGRPLHFSEATFGVRNVQLDPYLIGKFEVTQAQWLAITGETPSEWRMNEGAYGVLVTGRHPVEVVSHFECLAAAHRINCDLPTEAQWEHAARPIEKGLFWWPMDQVWNVPPENLMVHGDPRAYGFPWPGDNYALHAPVGTFVPNPWGLYDMLGNVWEHCRDPFKVALLRDASMTMRDGDGLVLADGGGDYSLRGCSFHSRPGNAHLAVRLGPPAGVRSGEHGLRFSRPVW